MQQSAGVHNCEDFKFVTKFRAMIYEQKLAYSFQISETALILVVICLRFTLEALHVFWGTYGTDR